MIFPEFVRFLRESGERLPKGEEGESADLVFLKIFMFVAWVVNLVTEFNKFEGFCFIVT